MNIYQKTRVSNLSKFKDSNFKSWREFSIKIGKKPSQISEAIAGNVRTITDVLARDIEKKLIELGYNVSMGFLDISDEQAVPVTMVPITQYEVKACAGSGKESYLEEMIEPVGIPIKVIKKLNTKIEHLFVIEVDGLSMTPTYNHEDYICIDKTKTSVNNNLVYLVKYDHELMIKRIDITAGMVTLKSDNQDKIRHPDITVKKNVQFDVIGEVVYKMGFVN